MGKTLLALLFFLALPLFLFAELSIYPPLSDSQRESYNHQIDIELGKTDRQLADLYQQMYGDPFPQATRARIRVAQEVLETKLIIASKFRSSKMLDSPIVREALLDFMKLEMISPQDIIKFQDIVESERKYMAEMQKKLEKEQIQRNEQAAKQQQRLENLKVPFFNKPKTVPEGS